MPSLVQKLKGVRISHQAPNYLVVYARLVYKKNHSLPSWRPGGRIRILLQNSLRDSLSRILYLARIIHGGDSTRAQFYTIVTGKDTDLVSTQVNAGSTPVDGTKFILMCVEWQDIWLLTRRNNNCNCRFESYRECQVLFPCSSKVERLAVNQNVEISKFSVGATIKFIS